MTSKPRFEPAGGRIFEWNSPFTPSPLLCLKFLQKRVDPRITYTPNSCSIQEEKPHLRRSSTLARKNFSTDFKSEAGAVINTLLPSEWADQVLCICHGNHILQCIIPEHRACCTALFLKWPTLHPNTSNHPFYSVGHFQLLVVQPKRSLRIWISLICTHSFGRTTFGWSTRCSSIKEHGQRVQAPLCNIPNIALDYVMTEGRSLACCTRAGQ